MNARSRTTVAVAAIAAALVVASGIALLQAYAKDSPRAAASAFGAAAIDLPSLAVTSLSQEGYAAIEGRTFDVTLEEWGHSTFVAAKRVDGRAEAAFFLMDDRGRIAYRFPKFHGNERGTLTGIRELAFEDADRDGLTDMIVIAESATTGAGEYEAKTFPIAGVYLRDGQSFRTLPMLDMQLNETGQNVSIDVVLANVEARLVRPFPSSNAEP
ncbi:hypothetical protein [Cohnella sp. GCM10027633]|uniref:hypothetical protein n=1 Tax=unclassified Cohnella TaxID=2636738 RepID=UPI00363F347E